MLGTLLPRAFAPAVAVPPKLRLLPPPGKPSLVLEPRMPAEEPEREPEPRMEPEPRKARAQEQCRVPALERVGVVQDQLSPNLRRHRLHLERQASKQTSSPGPHLRRRSRLSAVAPESQPLRPCELRLLGTQHTVV